VRGQAGEPADGEPGRDGGVAEWDLQVSVADLVIASRRAAVVTSAAGSGGQGDAAGECAADGGPEPGEGGQGGVPADPVPGTGLGLGSAEHVLSGLDRFFRRLAAPGDGDEIGHGRGLARGYLAQVEPDAQGPFRPPASQASCRSARLLSPTRDLPDRPLRLPVRKGAVVRRSASMAIVLPDTRALAATPPQRLQPARSARTPRPAATTRRDHRPARRPSCWPAMPLAYYRSSAGAALTAGVSRHSQFPRKRFVKRCTSRFRGNAAATA
jgi:hypothetical protein